MDSTNDTNRLEKRKKRFPFFTLVLDVLVFGILGMILGLTLNYFIPQVKVNESIKVTILWLTIQLIAAATVLTLVVKITPLVLSREAEDLGGLTVFGILFFAAQAQFRLRLNRLTKALLGSKTGLEGVEVIS